MHTMLLYMRTPMLHCVYAGQDSTFSPHLNRVASNRFHHHKPIPLDNYRALLESCRARAPLAAYLVYGAPSVAPIAR